MKNFNADLFISIALVLGHITGINAGGDVFAKNEISKILKDKIPDETRKEWLEDFKKWERECSQINLTMSAKTLSKLVEGLSLTTVTYGEFNELSQEFNGRLVDEMESMIFFSIEPNKKSLLLEKNQFGTNVSDAFPSTITDIEEASKCLVFERNTACVFHLMRVMELGLRVLGDTLNLPQSANRTWDSILDKCKKEESKPFTERAPEWQSNGTFLAEAAAMLRSVKDAWRNPTMHVEKVYTEEQVQDIWNAVKGFMRHLATELKE